jgi:hypothetical protein
MNLVYTIIFIVISAIIGTIVDGSTGVLDALKEVAMWKRLLHEIILLFTGMGIYYIMNL